MITPSHRLLKEQSSEKIPGEAKQTLGLYDKKQWQELLHKAIQQGNTDEGEHALLCISLDTLKILHTKGAAQLGEHLLTEVTQRLLEGLSDHKVARWGNGMFMALLNAKDQKTVQTLVDQLLKEVSAEDVQIGKNRIPVKLSLGVALIDDNSVEVKTLLVRAREACTQAMRQGGNRLSFYKSRKVSVVSSVEQQLANMIRQALKSDSMTLKYQPIVSLKGSQYDYYEVQLGFKDVRGREHSASRFRPKLDQSSLWGKVDRWQILQTCKALKDKRQTNKNTRIILHLGGQAILDKEFLTWMGVALKTSGVPGRALVIELSEQNVVRYKKEIPALLTAVKQMGCATAVCDFGCSLHPMETIGPLKLDFVKMDASFTKDLTSENKGAELKEMIKALSNQGRKVVVPQVSHASELAPLWHTGVDYIQGDFLQSPSDSMDYDFDSEL